MHETVFLVETLAHDGTPGDQVAGRVVGHVAVVLLRLDDRVEIAAIGDVDGDVAEPRTFDRQAFGIQERGNIGDAHLLDIVAFLPVFGDDKAGRRVEPEHAGRLRLHQPLLQRKGHRADGAVAAHRQAARRLDEQDGDVAVVTRRRVEDRTRHHVMAARLEHQPGADPVILGQEMRAPLHHGGAVAAAGRRRPPAGPDCRRYGRRCRRRNGGACSKLSGQNRCAEKAARSIAAGLPSIRSRTSRAVAAAWVSPRWPCPKA